MAHPEPLGWMARTLTVLVKGMSTTFDSTYPVEDFRDVHVDTEFPLSKDNYPGIWVDFEPTGELRTAGIGHIEFQEGEDAQLHPAKRWTFTGYATFTIVALSSFQRARLVDEVIKVMAFGDLDAVRNQFRTTIEDNAYLAMNFDFDEIGVVGKQEMQGTPWGSDEVVYEITVRMECVGEFVSDLGTQALALLEAVEVFPYTPAEPDPGEVPPLSDDPGAWR